MRGSGQSPLSTAVVENECSNNSLPVYTFMTYKATLPYPYLHSFLSIEDILIQEGPANVWLKRMLTQGQEAV